MRQIILKPRILTPSLAREMEKRKLVSFIHHPSESIRARLTKDYYKGADFRAASHVFHSVTITYTDIFLASHPDGQDEIVFNWDDARRTRPLYYAFALTKRDAYLSLLRSGKVEASDYLVIQAPMNDPRFSAFYVWHGTVHCECTSHGRSGQLFPSFFVLEPKKLVVKRTEEEKEGVKLVLRC
jgi:hypothetical protein